MTALAAEFWLAEVSRILEDATVLGASRYIEIHYEELTSEPESTIDKILGFARLPWTSQYHEFFSSFELTSRNAKVNTRLTGGQIETINHKTRDLASHLGY